MTEHEKTVQKLKLIIASFQQKLADADLATADAKADLALAEHELTQANQSIAELRDELAKAQASAAPKK